MLCGTKGLSYESPEVNNELLKEPKERQHSSVISPDSSRPAPPGFFVAGSFPLIVIYSVFLPAPLSWLIVLFPHLRVLISSGHRLITSVYTSYSFWPVSSSPPALRDPGMTASLHLSLSTAEMGVSALPFIPRQLHQNPVVGNILANKTLGTAWILRLI